MRARGCAGGVRRIEKVAAALLLCAVALTSGPARAGSGTLDIEPFLPTLARPTIAAEAPETDSWWQPRYLALYKTISYTAVVLTTDQLWYMTVAAQAATTSGLYGVVNLVTSPMLTYGFEYGWGKCCEAAPGPGGVRPGGGGQAAR